MNYLNDYSRIAYYTSGIKVSRRNYLLTWIIGGIVLMVVASLG